MSVHLAEKIVENLETTNVTAEYPSSLEDVDAKDVYKLSEELNGLSMQERDSILHDIHGVTDEVEETEELLDVSLKALKDVIEREKGKYAAYRMAEEEDVDYVTNHDFRLLFLRSEKFDGTRAGKKMLRFFELKLKLFGKEKLCKDIALSDLSKEDIQCLLGGYQQILPSRDTSGRAVLMGLWTHMPDERDAGELPLLRMKYYLTMTALEDIETQKKGFISIVHFVMQGNPLESTFATGANCLRIWPDLPLRLCCRHFCTDVKMLAVALWCTSPLAQFQDRVRGRVHLGSYEDCLFRLMTFGIPTKDFPVTPNYDLKPQNADKWIATRRTIEIKRRRGAKEQIVQLPSNSDVLFGRGPIFASHAGNLALGLLAEERLERYNDSSAKEKGAIQKEIISIIESRGGRFLKISEGVWVVVDRRAAQTKVGHTLRNLRHSRTTKQLGAEPTPSSNTKKRELDRQ